MSYDAISTPFHESAAAGGRQTPLARSAGEGGTVRGGERWGEGAGAAGVSQHAPSSPANPFPHGQGVTPVEAWARVQHENVVLIDVRTAEERKFVGHVPGSLHVPWATGTAMNRNPRFIRELEAKVAKDRTILLLCRSGKRSALAMDAAIKAGFTQVANVLEGFEGDLDEHGQRGHHNGWRHYGLPWSQD